tara:strand:+ start:2046 stop:2468 length:423 start_codon:yes stop_codon:yes gene_type:complete
MDEPNNKLPPESWHVIFRGADRSYWWVRFLRPSWSHVVLVRFDGFNWIKCEPNLAYTEISIITAVESDTIDTIASRIGHTGIEYLAKRAVIGEKQTMRTPMLFAPFTCVEVAKSVLGIRAWWVWTPWQLFNYIKDKQHGK